MTFHHAEQTAARAFWHGQLENGLGDFELLDALMFEYCAADSSTSPHQVALSALATEVVKKISKQTDLGTFVVVSAAVSMLAGRYTDRRAVTLEVPSAVGFADAQHTPGGTLPLLVPFDQLQTFKDLLVYFQRMTSDSYNFKDFPILELAQEEGIRVNSDVFIACAQVHANIAPHPYHNLCVVVLGGADIEIRLSSPSRKLPTWFLIEMGSHLDGLLGLFNSLDWPLTSFEAVVRRQSQARTARFNGTERVFSGETLGMGDIDCRRTTVLDLFERQARLRPAATALICESAALTYEELDGDAARLAAYLSGRFGVAPGQVVATLNTRSHWAVVTLLAVMKAGAVYLPLNPQASVQTMGRILAEADARALVAHSSYLDTIISLGDVPCFAIDLQLASCGLPTDNSSRMGREVGGDDRAYIIYTSGTTGVPKGVMVAHGGLANTTLDHIDRFGVKPTDRYLQFMAMSFDGFLLDTFTTLCAGATLVIADEEMIQDPTRLFDCIEKHKVTISTMTPSYLRLMDPSHLSTLRILVSAGEAINGKLARCYAERLNLYNGYGPTEATINSTLHRVDSARCDSTIPIGQPSANKKIYITNRRMEEQPIGVVGEICIAGAGLALGYVNDKDLTEARFVRDPFAAEGRLYRTGDFGAWTLSGELLFKGRSDSQVKVNGYRIDLREIQEALDACPEVGASQLLIHRSERISTEILAFYQLSASERANPAALAPPSGETIRRHLAQELPRYMLPHRLIEVTEWPLTTHGKTDASALWRLADCTGSDVSGYVAPSSPAEERLCEIWADVLEVGRVGVDDNFFSLGGDSIRVIQAADTAQRCGIRVEAADMLSHQTVRLLARHVGRTPTLWAEPEGKDRHDPLPLHLTGLSVDERDALPSGTEDAYPAALMQSLIIDTYEQDGGLNGIYHCCVVWTFEDSALSEDALRSALQHLYEMNRGLRTTFMRSSRGRDIVLIMSKSPLDVRRSDLRGTQPSELEALFRSAIERDTRDRFDPYSLDDPLIRFHIYRTADSTCSLLVSFHHAILDGWSGVEIRNLVMESYDSAKAGAELTTSGREVDSYKEYVSIEQAALRNTSIRSYWESALARDRVITSLHLFHNKVTGDRAARGHEHGTLEVGLPGTCVQAVGEYTRLHGTTPKALFLGCAAHALMEAVGVADLTIGVVTNGRSDRLSQPFKTLGLFWNIVPFTISAEDASSAERVHEQLNEMAPFGGFPLKEMEDGLARERLFMPCFNFVNYHNADPAKGLRLVEGVERSRHHFPLTFFVKLTKKAQQPSLLRIGFDRAYFSNSMAESILTLFRRQIDARLEPVHRVPDEGDSDDKTSFAFSHP